MEESKLLWENQISDLKHVGFSLKLNNINYICPDLKVIFFMVNFNGIFRKTVQFQFLKIIDFLFGDNIFETIKVLDNKVCYFLKITILD